MADEANVSARSLPHVHVNAIATNGDRMLTAALQQHVVIRYRDGQGDASTKGVGVAPRRYMQ
jgi:hypothetical protein